MNNNKLREVLREYIADNTDSKNLMKDLKVMAVQESLVVTRGNQTQAAIKLGINRGSLRNNMKD